MYNMSKLIKSFTEQLISGLGFGTGMGISLRLIQGLKVESVKNKRERELYGRF
tara:strand:+ start:1830 stop:1988 length:159 start_codon:yes stop_codon:yes gene_type:complete